MGIKELGETAVCMEEEHAWIGLGTSNTIMESLIHLSLQLLHTSLILCK